MVIRKNYKYIILFIFFITSSCATIEYEQHEYDQREIMKCFNIYKKTLVEKDYEKLITLITENTYIYYSKIIKLAIYGSKRQIIELPLLIDKIYILIMRFTIPVDQLLNMNGEDFFIYGMKNNILDMNMLAKTSLNILKINKKNAEALLIFSDNDKKMKINFIKEKNSWKIDIKALFDDFNSYYEGLLVKHKLTEIDFLKNLIYGFLGKEITEESMFEPLL